MQRGHGAHVHLGGNLIDRLRAALDAIYRLRCMLVLAPAEMTTTIAAERPVSEALSGPGEAKTLGEVTVKIGQVADGTSMNLSPASARAGIDIRLPVGGSLAEVETQISTTLSSIERVTWTVLRRYEPSYTLLDSEIVQAVVHAATMVPGTPPAVNMRMGGSASRVCRAAGIPTVVYGPTPVNIGKADEYPLLEELHQVAIVHTFSSLSFLSKRRRAVA